MRVKHDKLVTHSACINHDMLFRGSKAKPIFVPEKGRASTRFCHKTVALKLIMQIIKT